jgi:5-methylcytosine-specific restriction enzyme subunit McrC
MGLVFHHPGLGPRAKLVSWQTGPEAAVGNEQLPQMKTEVTLTCGSRTLIDDAKDY